MSQQPELTPKQQALLDFLNELATTPLTPERLAHGISCLTMLLTNVANSRTRSDSSKELQPSNQEHYCHAKL